MLVIGFDLDLTLADPRPGVVATCAALSRETGTLVDGEVVASRLGPPVETELAHWFDAADVPAVADLYRALFARHGVAGTTALPGAADALAAVRRSGGRVLVVTAKSPPLAAATLDALGLVADEVHGWRWGDGKATTLRAAGASAYVGDHVADVAAALAAGAFPVAVTTGPCAAADLAAAGAGVVLPGLPAFAGWWAGFTPAAAAARIGP